MRTTYGALIALGLLGGYLAWRNRFAIQRQLESWGIRTPTMTGGAEETMKSVASQAAGESQEMLNRAKSATREAQA